MQIKKTWLSNQNTDSGGRFKINYPIEKAIAVNLASTANYAIIRYLNETQSLVYVYSVDTHEAQPDITTNGWLFFVE